MFPTLTNTPYGVLPISRAKGPGSTIERACRISGILLLALALAPLSSWAQQGKVEVQSNEQLFCVLAALNDAGYDTGTAIDTGSKAREAIRADLVGKKIPVLPEIEKFYQAHKIAGRPGLNLGQFVSLALLLGPPPDFKFTVAPTDLPPDARNVAGLVPLLRTFYKQADLADIWARAQVDSQTEAERYSPRVRRAIELTDGYLRFPAGAYLGRTYSIYLDLLGAPNQVQGRIYGSHYYLVITPSKKLRINDIRYYYLHFLLDPLAVKYAPEIHHAIALEALARKAPALRNDFKSDFTLLVTECLIRAIEIRMDKVSAAQAKKQVDQLTASGFILVPYFYNSLLQYEKQEGSMSVFYQQMIEGIKPSKEMADLSKVHFSKPAPEAAPAPELSEMEQLLDQGDNDIYSGKYLEANAVFQRVLQKNPHSERALFGMAVAASNSRKPDIARKYFEETLSVARDLRIVTWSHIYLGRLDDVEGDRKKALAQYKAASLTAGAYPEAV
ncbi:MAG: hypothetical protein P8Z30_18115, partial [Acidobacteriota bacterium]